MRENKWRYFIVLTIVSTVGLDRQGIAQQKEAVMDSLWQAVKRHYKTAPDIALDYVMALQVVADKNDDQEQEANALFSIGYLNYKKGQYSASLEAYFKVLTLYKTLENEAYLVNTNKNIGKIFTDIKRDHEARSFYQEALLLSIKRQNKEKIAEMYFLLGIGYVNQNNFEQAKIHLHKSLKLSQSSKINRMSYNWLGELFRKRGDAKTAIGYYYKSLALCKDKSSNRSKATALLNLGITYLALNKPNQARTYAEQSLAISTTLEGNRTIKPQILLAEIAMKEGGTGKEELYALINTIETIDAEVFNAYYNEALVFVGEKENIMLLESNEVIDITARMGVQLKVSMALYETVKQQLNNHALQMVMNKIKTTEKLEALEKRSARIKWGMGALFILFMGMIFWRFRHFQRKKRLLKKRHAQLLIEKAAQLAEIKTRLSVAKQEIINKELEDIEKAVVMERKDEEIKELDKENSKLLDLDAENNEMMVEMITDISNANELIKKINQYIREIRTFMEERGYDIPPPLWDIGDDRDN